VDFGNVEGKRYVEPENGSRPWRDLQLGPAADADPVNYFIYPHVLVDGKPHIQVDQHFHFTDRE